MTRLAPILLIPDGTAMSLAEVRPLPRGRRTALSPWAAALSVALHGAALAAVLLLLHRPDRPNAGAGQSVELVWQEQTGEEPGEPSEPPPPAALEVPEAPPPAPEAPPVPPAPEAPPVPRAPEAPPTPQVPPAPPPVAAIPPPPLAAMLPPPLPEVTPPVTLPPPPPDEPAEQPPPSPEAPPPEAPEPLPIPPPQPPPPPQQAQPQPQPRPRPTPARPAAQAPAPPAPPPRGAIGPQPTMPGAAPVLGAVTPPGLMEGIRNPEPEYPAASQRRGEQGVVTLLLRISETGSVQEVEVVHGSGYAVLDESAKRAVRRWRFRPATRDGTPIPGSIRTAIHFRLLQ